MTKHSEIRTYTFYDIPVTVQINYDKEIISIIEKKEDDRYDSKEWIFIKRGLEYMNGWRNILAAIGYAIDEAETELSEYLKLKKREKADEITETLIEASGIVRNRSEKRRLAIQKQSQK